MSEQFFSVWVREPSNTIVLPWRDGIRVVVSVWVRVNGSIFREDAGAFAVDGAKRVLNFTQFEIDCRDDVLIGGVSINVLEALALAAQD